MLEYVRLDFGPTMYSLIHLLYRIQKKISETNTEQTKRVIGVLSRKMYVTRNKSKCTSPQTFLRRAECIVGILKKIWPESNNVRIEFIPDMNEYSGPPPNTLIVATPLLKSTSRRTRIMYEDLKTLMRSETHHMCYSQPISTRKMDDETQPRNKESPVVVPVYCIVGYPEEKQMYEDGINRILCK